MTKRGMRGFAAGLWVAAVILAYFYFLGPNLLPTAAKNKNITQKQVDAYLANHGKMSIGDSEYASLKSSANKASNKQSKSKKKKSSSNKGSNKSDSKSSSSSSSNDNSQSNNVKTYTLTVSSGMTGGQIGSQLEKAGILSNGNDLANYLQNHNLANKVQLGTFTFKSNMSVADIANKITQ